MCPSRGGAAISFAVRVTTGSRTSARNPLVPLHGLPPAGGAIVMATGIISVGLHLIQRETLSRILLVIAALVWLVLAFDFAERFLVHRERWVAESDNPAALDAVAACCILGNRIGVLGWNTLAAVLLGLAVAVWPFLTVNVVLHWKKKMPGGVFLACVGCEAVAVLAGLLAGHGAHQWLDEGALAAFLLGLVLYAAALPLFEFGQLLTGKGDHWVAGGSLAIAALAVSRLADSPTWTGWFHQALRTVTVVLLVVSLAWYAVLAVFEFRRPRLHYDLRRWSTIFPLGMFGAATLSTATLLNSGRLHTFGSALLWLSLPFWLVVAAGTLRHTR